MHTPISEMPIELQVDGIETRASECGGVLARHIGLPPGVDFTPSFEGLPDDLCQSPHGVRAGRLDPPALLRWHRELSSAGGVYYWRGGHTGWTDDGVTFLEFSPTAEIRPVLEHLATQMSAAG